MAKKKEKRLRQRPLPKMGILKIPKLDALAEHFEDSKLEFGEAGESLKTAEENLRAMMKEKKLTLYKTPSGITVIYSSKEKVTTKKLKEKTADVSA